jgi:hypothetical protein
MHKAKPYGHLVVNGATPTIAQIANLSGTTEAEAAALLSDLEKAGVFSRNKAKTIYSRRMVKDEKKRIDGETSQKKPRISKDGDTTNHVENTQQIVGPTGSPPGLFDDDPDTQRLETREVSKEEEKEAPSGASKNADPEIVSVAAPIEPEPKEKSRAKRRASIPEDWQPDHACIEHTRSKGYRDDQVPPIAEHFVSHHRAKGNVFADIPAAWRTWIATDLRMYGHPAGRSGARPGRPTGGYRQGGRSDVEIIADLVAEAERAEQGGGVRMGDDDDGFFGGLRVVS